jgi:hypothetical protein
MSPGRWPPGRTHSTTAVQIGISATSTAASPDGTNCSAQTTPPLPPSRKSAPRISAARHDRPAGLGAPRLRAKPYISSPATRNRTPAMRNGGIDSIATRMAR